MNNLRRQNYKNEHTDMNKQFIKKKTVKKRLSIACQN